MENKKLYLSKTDKKIAGVCSGLAKYFNIDVVFVRVLFLASIFIFWGVFVYLLFWLLTPREE